MALFILILNKAIKNKHVRWWRGIEITILYIRRHALLFLEIFCCLLKGV